VTLTASSGSLRPTEVMVAREASLLSGEMQQPVLLLLLLLVVVVVPSGKGPAYSGPVRRGLFITGQLR